MAVENVCLCVPACVCILGDAAHAHGACTSVYACEVGFVKQV